jgi:hypothetical protein
MYQHDVNFTINNIDLIFFDVWLITSLVSSNLSQHEVTNIQLRWCGEKLTFVYVICQDSFHLLSSESSVCLILPQLCLSNSAGSLVSSTNKTSRHVITEILLKEALNTISQTNPTHRCLLHHWFIFSYLELCRNRQFWCRNTQ